MKSTQRKEINFERHHKLRSEQILIVKSILTDQHQIPHSITDIIIDLVTCSYYKSFCKIHLSFKSNDDNIFAIAKIPNKNRNSVCFDSLSMGGNVNNLPMLESFKWGSGYGGDWGNNDETFCRDWKFHSYCNIRIPTDKDTNNPTKVILKVVTNQLRFS